MSKSKKFNSGNAEVDANAEAAWGRLTRKRRDFCEQYIITHNGSEAAKAAGYSPKTAKEQGSRLLTNDNIQDVIGGLQAIRSVVAILSFEQRAEILTRIAVASVSSLLSEDKTNKLSTEGVHASGPALASISHSSSTFSSEHGGDSESERWTVKTRDPIAAIHELNLMYGSHAPKKIELDSESIDPNAYTDAELMAMLDEEEEGDE